MKLYETGELELQLFLTSAIYEGEWLASCFGSLTTGEIAPTTKTPRCSAPFLVRLLNVVHMEVHNNQFCFGFMCYIVANDVRRYMAGADPAFC
jgi:hypothetical protein